MQTPESQPKQLDSKSSDEESFTSVKAPDASSEGTEHRIAPVKAAQPLIVEAPYSPTIFGLEAARVHCRFMMNRIVGEVVFS